MPARRAPTPPTPKIDNMLDRQVFTSKATCVQAGSLLKLPLVALEGACQLRWKWVCAGGEALSFKVVLGAAEPLVLPSAATSEDSIEIAEACSIELQWEAAPATYYSWLVGSDIELSYEIELTSSGGQSDVVLKIAELDSRTESLQTRAKELISKANAALSQATSLSKTIDAEAVEEEQQCPVLVSNAGPASTFVFVRPPRLLAHLRFCSGMGCCAKGGATSRRVRKAPGRGRGERGASCSRDGMGCG